MKKFTFSRSAIVSETFVVEAETEAEARELLWNADPVSSDFLDYYTDGFEFEYDEDITTTKEN